jgi:hypothetical protein
MAIVGCKNDGVFQPAWGAESVDVKGDGRRRRRRENREWA